MTPTEHAKYYRSTLLLAIDHYDKNYLVPVSRDAFTLARVFYAGGDALVQPKLSHVKDPSPVSPFHVMYRRWIYNQTNWQTRVLMSAEMKAQYDQPLTPADRAAFMDPFFHWVVPFAASIAKPGVQRHKAPYHVKYFEFVPADLILVKAKPQVPGRPFTLYETTNKRYQYLCHTAGMRQAEVDKIVSTHHDDHTRYEQIHEQE